MHDRGQSSQTRTTSRMSDEVLNHFFSGAYEHPSLRAKGESRLQVSRLHVLRYMPFSKAQLTADVACESVGVPASASQLRRVRCYDEKLGPVSWPRVPQKRAVASVFVAKSLYIGA